MHASTANTQAPDERLVTFGILAVQVVEQAAALVDHHQQATTGMVVLLVGLEMTREMLDFRGEQRDLYFGGSSVAGSAPEILDDLACVDGHLYYLW